MCDGEVHSYTVSDYLMMVYVVPAVDTGTVLYHICHNSNHLSSVLIIFSQPRPNQESVWGTRSREERGCHLQYTCSFGVRAQNDSVKHKDQNYDITELLLVLINMFHPDHITLSGFNLVESYQVDQWLKNQLMFLVLTSDFAH